MLAVLVMDRNQVSSGYLEARMGNIERRDSEGNLETERLAVGQSIVARFLAKRKIMRSLQQ
jgi:hypothetical protein